MRTLLAILAIISLSFAGCVEEPARSEPEPTPAEPDTGNTTLEPLSFAATVKLVRGNLTIDTPVVFAAGSDLRADAAANATWTAQLIQMNATTNVTQSAGNATGMGVSGEGNLTPSLAGNLTLRLTVVAEGDDDTTAFLNISIGQNMTEAFTIPEPLVFTGTFSGPSASGIPGDSATLEFSVDGPVSKMVFSMEYTELAGAPEADNDLELDRAQLALPRITARKAMSVSRLRAKAAGPSCWTSTRYRATSTTRSRLRSAKPVDPHRRAILALRAAITVSAATGECDNFGGPGQSS